MTKEVEPSAADIAAFMESLEREVRDDATNFRVSLLVNRKCPACQRGWPRNKKFFHKRDCRYTGWSQPTAVDLAEAYRRIDVDAAEARRRVDMAAPSVRKRRRSRLV